MHRSSTISTLFAVLLLLLLALAAPAQEATQSPAARRAGIAANEPAAATRRAQTFLRSRGSGSATAAEALQNAREQHLGMLRAQATPLSTAWTPVGPLQVQSLSYGLVTGRVAALALDPNDAGNNTLYVGTSGGGVWKSTNAASPQVSFTPLTDTLSVFSPNAGTGVVPSLSIGALTVQPGGTGVILAGTGDPNDATDSYYGEGILRSANGGQTWSLIQSAGTYTFNGEGIAGFAWSTASPSTVVVAVSSAAESANVGGSKYPGVRGLYYSTNAGASWTLATIQDGSTVLQNRTTSFTGFRGNAATSVVWNPVRKKFYAAVRSHGYYESPDGITWTRLTNQPGTGLSAANCPARPGDYGLLSCPIFRGTVTSQPNSGDMFAITVDANNVDQGLWQDTCAKSGTACTSSTVGFATKLDATPAEAAGSIPSGDYNLSLAAIPAATALSATDTLLFLGTADLYRCSLAGGCALRNTTNATTGCAAPAGVAPSQHALAWGANLANAATPALFLGNDSGLWRSLDGVRQQAAVCSADDATHFDNLNGSLGSLAEVAALSSHPADGNVMLAALGANGAVASTSSAQVTGGSPWAQLTAAESGAVSIDQGNGNNWLLQSGSGVALHVCTAGKQCSATDFAGPAAIGYAQVNGDASLMDPPALLDPALNTNLITGTCRVWRGPAAGGSSWSTSNSISAPLSGVLSAGMCTSGNAAIRSLAAGGQTQLSSATQNSGSPVLYAGLSGALEGGSSAGGHIFTTSAAGTAGSSTAWTDLTSNSVTNDTTNRFNAGGFDVSSIAVDRADLSGMTVYATVQGFGYPHVYRSTNGGGTWLNISANLPNAPANAVAVDPNNPRTVYVAMDTGVYVASDVTTCVAAASGTTGACWSVYGTSLPNAPVTALSVTQAVSVPGSSAAGVLRAATYGRGVWQMPLLTAGQVSAAVATFSRASLTFGTQAAGTTSAAQTVTVTNTGTAAMQISGVVPSTGFLETDTCSGRALAINGTCALSVSFAPTVAGAITGSVQVIANITGGYSSLTLSGTATGVSKLAVSPASIAFGDVPVNSTSTAQTITVSNIGNGPATLSSPTVTPGYTVVSSACGSTLAVASTCNITVAFAPTTAGANNGSLKIADSNATATVLLSGNGTGKSKVVYSTSSITFHDGTVGTLGGVAVLTFINQGTANANMGVPTITGDFTINSDSCPTVAYPGITCSVVLYFYASGTGLRTGALTMIDDAGPHVIALQGKGFPAAQVVQTAQLVFPSTRVNSVSAAQTVSVVNTGGLNPTFGVTQVSGDFAITATTCGQYLFQPGCNFTVVFTPSADGPRNGLLQTTLNGTPYYTVLSGTALGTPNETISPAALDFGSVGIGSLSDPQTVQITSSGTAALALQSQTVSDDFHITGNTCTTSLAVKTSCAVSVDFVPTSNGPHTGTLTLVDALGTHTVPLTGTGSGRASVGVSPASVNFGVVSLGQSATQTVTVSNTGNADIGLLSPLATGDFVVSSSTCGARIAAGSTCTIAVVFTPAADGGRTGTLTVADTAATHTVVLNGTGRGTSAAAFTPATLVFGNTALATVSPAQTVTLSNTGSAAANLQAATISGDFKIATNTCGSTLAAGTACTLGITFGPSTVGVRSGILSIADDAGTHSVALGGTGTAGVLTLSPTAVDFYDTTLNTTTVVRTVTLTNTGNSRLTLGTVTVTDDFSVSANCNGIQLSGGGTCTLSITFSPKTAGAHTGIVTVPSDSNGVAGTLSTVALTGNGKGAFNLTLNPTAVDFGTQRNGVPSPVTNVTLSNTGTTGGAITGITVTGTDFAIKANTCGTSLASQVGCTVALVFTPVVSGVRTGTVTIVSDAGTQTVPLTGIGQAAATDALTPLALTFGPQIIGTVSAIQNVTLTNSGDVPLTLVSAAILSGDFTAANNCGPTLPAHTSCAVSVAFSPRSVGGQTGTLEVTDVQRAQLVTLNGTGLAPAGVTLTPASLAYANTGVGVVGAGQQLTLSNRTAAAVTLTGVTVIGNFGILANTGNCATAAVIPAGGSCTLGVAFLPQGSGIRTGSVVVTTSATTLTSQLTGNGIDFTLAVNGFDTATLSSGGSATYPLLLRPAVNTTDPVTFTCTGAPANTRCTVTSQYGDLSATGTVSVTLLTGTTPKSIRAALCLPLLCLPLLLLPLCLLQRRLRPAATLLLVCLGMFAVQGCGSGKNSAASGSGNAGGSGGATPITPTGTYTVTVAATAAGVTHTVPLTLKVD